MKKYIFVLYFFMQIGLILAFQFTGNPQNWRQQDLIGFDKVGDAKNLGDIASVYFRQETDDSFLRITFDDMATRSHLKFSKDNYKNKKIELAIAIDGRKLRLNLDTLYAENAEYDFLRTPQNNLLELKIPKYLAKNKQISIKTVLEGELQDSFVGKLRRSRDTGNCAFVHHGNQGLTYTEVFYGSASGESGLDGSGFDEVLEVHEATGVPGNFHMSGTLMPAAQWHNPEFNDWLTQMSADGQAAMMTSALGQHIMPFVQNEMNNWSVNIECDMVDYRYNYVPHVAWVPERVWLAPGYYPDAGVIDWLGDNWTQHDVWGVVLDDWPHLSGYDNRKIHWMSNGSDIDLRVIPINNEFVGNMHYDANAAKNQIAGMGQYNICVYGTDWEVAAEMNEHDGSFFLDNYENVLWYCHDNYPGVNVWKLDNALTNPDFNGVTADITHGTYGLLGGTDGYGGGNNGWYTHWAGAESHSDFHDPKWNYGFIWNNAYENLINCPDNNLAQLGWYTLMINLHETGWHDGEEISGWEHRYSAHMKNANVYAEASRWANGDYAATTAAYLEDIDRDGVDEVVMHNDKLMAVFESIGGKANWIFAKDDNGGQYSVVGSDMAYWSETDGDYNESSNNHVAALSESSPNLQHDIYEWNLLQTSGDEVEVEFTKNDVTKICKLQTGNSYLEVEYAGSGDTYVKSGWSPDLLDLIWSGKENVQRMWGDFGSYCGRRNSTSGATAAYVLGNGGAQHNSTFEGTLVMGDEIKGGASFKLFLYAGYTSAPYDEYNNKVEELDNLATILEDDIPPTVWQEQAAWVGQNKLQLTFSEAINVAAAENEANYQLQGFSGSYTVAEAVLTHNRRVVLTANNDFSADDLGEVVLQNITDLNGNEIAPEQNTVAVVNVIRPHLVGSFNAWQVDNHSYDLILQNNGLWQVTLALDAGVHEYKVVESDAWDDNDYPSENQAIVLDDATEVKFYVNCGAQIETYEGIEYVCHSTNLPVVAGDFLAAIGGTNWNEQTELTVMNDEGLNGDEVSGDGIFTRLVQIPAGSYEYKIVLNNNWDQNTTSGNLNFSISQTADVTFYYNMIENTTDLNYELVANDQQPEFIPQAAKITAVYPNPFTPTSAKNSSTEIKFKLKSPQKIQLNAYNIKGQLVKKLAVGKFGTGEHKISWNMQQQDLATGIYFIKLQASHNCDVRRMLYLK